MQPGRLAGALLGVAVRALDPCRGDRGADVIVGCAGAHETAQVAARGGEEAGVQAAVSGEPGPGAVGAERLGDRGDDADLPGAVGVTPALGDLAPVARPDRNEGQLGVDGPFVWPTSMYSMNRRMWPFSRK